MDYTDWEQRVSYARTLTRCPDPAAQALGRSTLTSLHRMARAGLVKVGPKGYIHGWIFVGVPAAGDAVHHPKHGHGTVHRVDEHGHVHVRFESGARRSFQRGSGAGGGLTRRGEAGNDVFTGHIRAAAAANRRGDHTAAAEHYRQAAEAATHPRIREEMRARAARDEARPGRAGRAAEPTPSASASAATRDLHAATVAALPTGKAAWLAPVRYGGYPEQRRVDTQLAVAQRELDEAQADLAAATDAALAEVKRQRMPRADRAEAVDRFTKPQQAAVGMARTFHDYMTRAKQRIDAGDLTGDTPDDRQIRVLAEMMPAFDGHPRYPHDPNGVPVPPPEFEQHLDRIMSLGAAVAADVDAAIAADKVVADLQTQIRQPGDGPTSALRKQINQRQQQIVMDVLRSLRPFGGITHSDVTVSEPPPARADWVERLRIAEAFFPEDWLRMSSGKPMGITSADRAYYSPLGSILAMGKAVKSEHYVGAFADDLDETTVHEMGHRMEHMVPGLTAMEFTFVRRYTTTGGTVETTVKLADLFPGTSYDEDEVAYPDQWAHPYTGKTYDLAGRAAAPSTTHWEAFQVGLQDTLGMGLVRYGNDALRHFTLGALAALAVGGAP